MPSHVTDSLIFGDFYSTEAMRAVFDDRHLVACWLATEAALARAQAGLGIIPAEAAHEISRQASAGQIDLAKLRQSTNLVGYPIVGLVKQLSASCAGEAGRRGALPRGGRARGAGGRGRPGGARPVRRAAVGTRAPAEAGRAVGAVGARRIGRPAAEGARRPLVPP